MNAITYTHYKEHPKPSDLYNRGELIFEDSDLTYSATSRCPCGAGLAHVNDARKLDMNFWDCSAILKGEAIPSGEEGSVQHTGQMPFNFYEVKTENQPSAGGSTTRPNAKIKVYSIITHAETPLKRSYYGDEEGANRELIRMASQGHSVTLEVTEVIRNPT